MALLTILDGHGRPHLIHSSQIAPAPRPPQAVGEWDDVWARWPADNRPLSEDPAEN